MTKREKPTKGARGEPGKPKSSHGTFKGMRLPCNGDKQSATICYSAVCSGSAKTAKSSSVGVEKQGLIGCETRIISDVSTAWAGQRHGSTCIYLRCIADASIRGFN